MRRPNKPTHMKSTAVYKVWLELEIVQHNTHTEDKNIDTLTIKSHSFDSVRFVIIVKIEANKKAMGLMAQLTEISCSTDDYSYTYL